MAQYACVACGFEGPYQEFKVNPDFVPEDSSEEAYDEVELECPECGSESVGEV